MSPGAGAATLHMDDEGGTGEAREGRRARERAHADGLVETIMGSIPFPMGSHSTVLLRPRLFHDNIGREGLLLTGHSRSPLVSLYERWVVQKDPWEFPPTRFSPAAHRGRRFSCSRVLLRGAVLPAAPWMRIPPHLYLLTGPQQAPGVMCM